MYKVYLVNMSWSRNMGGPIPELENIPDIELLLFKQKNTRGGGVSFFIR